MSAETDFRSAMLSYAPLAAAVSQRVSQSIALQESELPVIVFSASHTPELGIDGSAHLDQVKIEAQVWAASSAQAHDLAEMVSAALAQYENTNPVQAWVDNVVDGVDADLGIYAEIVSITWYSQ